MTDRELLEYAAKAAGIGPLSWIETDGTNIVANVRWNPLSDDGDAFRLAVKLKLETEFGSDFVNVGTSDMNMSQWHLARESGDDLYATFRRAIVRAAAEIGKTMT